VGLVVEGVRLKINNLETEVRDPGCVLKVMDAGGWQRGIGYHVALS
jgi:hypothetical protein